MTDELHLSINIMTHSNYQTQSIIQPHQNH